MFTLFAYLGFLVGAFAFTVGIYLSLRAIKLI